MLRTQPRPATGLPALLFLALLALALRPLGRTAAAPLPPSDGRIPVVHRSGRRLTRQPHPQTPATRRLLYQTVRPQPGTAGERGRWLLRLLLTAGILTVLGGALGRLSMGIHPTVAPTLVSAGVTARATDRGHRVATILAAAEDPASDASVALGAARPFHRLPATSGAAVSLLPRESVPLTNEAAAAYFPDGEGARRAMAAAGRLGGMRTEYRVSASTGGPPVAAAVTVAQYHSATAAETALRDPTAALTLHGLGVVTSELDVTRDAAPPRAFRGTRGADVDAVVYVVQLRRGQAVVSVVVEMAAEGDDGGQLAFALARSGAPLQPGHDPGEAQRGGTERSIVSGAEGELAQTK